MTSNMIILLHLVLVWNVRVKSIWYHRDGGMRSPPKFWQRHYSNKGEGGKFRQNITTFRPIRISDLPTGLNSIKKEKFSNQWKIERYKEAFLCNCTEICLFFFRDCHLRHPMYRLIIFRRYLLLTLSFLQREWQIFLRTVV